jgi:hypothetical protein
MKQKESFFGPLFLIAAGVTWLLVKSGNIPASNLWALTHIWPFLLIAAGIGLILKPYWTYTSLVLDVIIIGGTILALVYAPQLGWDRPSATFIMHDNEIYLGPAEAGSGKVITQPRNVGDILAVNVDYPAQVIVRQGDSQSVLIEAEDNLLPHLKTQVRDGALEIFYASSDRMHVNPTKPVKIMIVVNDLNQLNLTSAGEVIIEGFRTDELDLSLSGAGNTRLNEVSVQNLSVNLSGAGSMTASGTVDNLGLDISGFGSFNGKQLHGQTAIVDLNGAGSATLWVDEQLDAQISGAGTVNYYGSAHVSQRIYGLGRVTHLPGE